MSAIGLHDAAAIESAVAAFARDANGGLVMTASPFGGNHPDVIPMLATRYKLPAVYPWRYFVTAGGLMSYGSDLASQFRLVAQYVDRILKGEKPGDLPVQAPTKYELIINRKGREASRPPGTGAHQVRTGHQPQDRQGARPHRAAINEVIE